MIILYFRYSFAIVGINITAMAYKLVMDGCAKSHFFNVCASSPVESERTPLLKHFHHFYSYLFVEFDKFWLAEKPKDVMEFNRIRDLFENNIRTLLEDRSAHFKINITVDTVWISNPKRNAFRVSFKEQSPFTHYLKYQIFAPKRMDRSFWGWKLDF